MADEFEHELRPLIEELWEDHGRQRDPGEVAAVEHVVNLLDNGELRVATKDGEEWTVHEWIKKAVLLYFQLRGMETHLVGPYEYYDKIPLKHSYKDLQVRVVPPAVARHGAYLSPGVILMPSYVNIGAWVGPNTMVDTWATVGSCAQIGANVHLAGGVGIGGVLEPLQARPVIVEDGAFIGSRCIITEGAVIGREAVLSAGVSLTGSVPIIDVTGPEPKEYRGYVPPRSIVVPGTRSRKFPSGEYQLNAALIIGQRQPSTDLKVSLNDALREYALSS
jgi:2,3,4,5-tetrahydropyridine-2,6-dicarboxylate N-succinyltransferase